jgi:CRISPR-associated protein Csd1
MILQELVHYYERKAADPDCGIAPEGWELKEIPFVIVIDCNGKFVNIEDTRSGEGKKRRGKMFLVPQGEKKTSGVKANLLWDNMEYVLGVDALGKEGKASAKHKAFVQRLEEKFHGIKGDCAISALLKFLTDISFDVMMKLPVWEEIKEINPNLAFRIDSDNPDRLLFHRDGIRQAVKPVAAQPNGVCLVGGKKDEIERLHPSIKGVWGAQSSGANIISFNLDAFQSYGKKQSFNAPVGKAAAFAYTTALNQLLAKGSAQRLQVGDASTVFWADRAGSVLEDVFADLFSESPKDDPDRNTHAVEALFNSIRNGSYTLDQEDNTRFFVLGLSPNAARISVRFWLTGTVAEFAGKIRQHFDDIAVVHREKEPKHLSLFRLLEAVALADKADNIPPNLGGDVMRAILSGTPYPLTLFQGAIRRIRATQHVTYARAAIVKACLNRQNRFTQSNTKELIVSLDPENTHPAYLLGRLFAILEKVQKEAQPGINATIRDRFYGSFSSSPSSVFAILMRLKNHHLAKLSEGSKTYYEKMIGDIVALLPSSGVPSHLPLADQGRFAIGYYHQNHALYAKQDKGEKNV